MPQPSGPFFGEHSYESFSSRHLVYARSRSLAAAMNELIQLTLLGSSLRETILVSVPVVYIPLRSRDVRSEGTSQMYSARRQVSHASPNLQYVPLLPAHSVAKGVIVAALSELN